MIAEAWRVVCFWRKAAPPAHPMHPAATHHHVRRVIRHSRRVVNATVGVAFTCTVVAAGALVASGGAGRLGEFFEHGFPVRESGYGVGPSAQLAVPANPAPQIDNPKAVPEPSTLLMYGAAAVATLIASKLFRR